MSLVCPSFDMIQACQQVQGEHVYCSIAWLTRGYNVSNLFHHQLSGQQHPESQASG